MFYDVSCDIETTGTDPVHNSIIQIAAVRFDLNTKTVHDDMFDMALKEAPGRYWSESTREWWTGSDTMWEVYKGIKAREQEPREVLEAFIKWVRSFPLPFPVRLWAKPTHFEYPFLESYFKQYNLNNPFHYRNCVDLNSYIAGRGHENNYEFWKTIESVGDAHNALHDSLYQVRAAFAA